MKSPTPCTIITGFLGAGKTTTIQHLIHNVKNKKLALIINEFGELGIDGKLIEDNCADSCCEDGIVELANGCICCTVGEDFIPAMETLLSLKSPPDHIIIETSGLALPQPLLRAFLWPNIQGRACIDSVIMIADAPALVEGRFSHNENTLQTIRTNDETLDHETPLGELFHDQLISSDIIVLNKIDCVAPEHITQLEKRLAQETGRPLRYYKTQYGQCDPHLLLGLGLDSHLDASNRLSLHERNHQDRNTHHDNPHDDHHSNHDNDHHDNDHHDNDHQHDHHAFDSVVIPLTIAIEDKNAFLTKLENLLDNPHIYRVKGSIHIENKKRPLVIQAVGKRIESYFSTQDTDKQSSQFGLVFIGTTGNVNIENIRQHLGIV